MQILQNGAQVPTNSDTYKLTEDMATMGATLNVIIPVQNKDARDALENKFPGMTVARLDLPGVPKETYDGTNWHGQIWTPYTPVWAGWYNLGTGFESTGSYMMVGPNLCLARMKLKAGTSGAALGTGAIAVSLPFTTAAGMATNGEGQWLLNGPFGGLQKIMLSAPGANNQAAIYSNPTGAAIAQPPGAAGFGYGSPTEVHATITYRTA